MIPLILFIFPGVFVVLVGPAGDPDRQDDDQMRKQQITDAPSIPHRRAGRRAAAIVLGLALSPLIYEGSTVVADRWRVLLGSWPASVSTPVSDTLAGALNDGVKAFTAIGLELIRVGGKQPNWAIGLAVVWGMLGGGFLLRNR